jgi:cobalamin biosynthesis protein CobD/CbiB
MASPGLYEVWYLLAGFLMGNGVPHFVFGRAGKIFRSPFGQRSSPSTNVLWGMANFVLAAIVVATLGFLDLASGFSPALLLLGFLLAVVMFGTGMKRFLNE